MSNAHGLRFAETQFWVIHRRKEYGPFDYEWSDDFCGMELTFRGLKFGEVCSIHQFFADLKEFELPMRVVEVASVVFGCMLMGISQGYSSEERALMLISVLKEFDCDDYVPNEL